MTIAAYQVKIENNDRGHHSTKFFSALHDAKRFFNNYKMTPGDQVQLLSITSKALITQK